jgi:hypothetical protein
MPVDEGIALLERGCRISALGQRRERLALVDICRRGAPRLTDA